LPLPFFKLPWRLATPPLFFSLSGFAVLYKQALSHIFSPKGDASRRPPFSLCDALPLVFFAPRVKSLFVLCFLLRQSVMAPDARHPYGTSNKGIRAHQSARIGATQGVSAVGCGLICFCE